MGHELSFVETHPATAATQLDAGSIHLWRIPYASSQGRAPLLALLGVYLGKPASEVALAQSAHGKPQLADADSARRLGFNWSHSGDYALVALSRDVALGVDIERLNKNIRAVDVARRFFDPAEADVLASMPSPARNHAFIGLWCSKEAVLKAVGKGLSFGLARIAFEWRAGMDWDLAHVDPALGDTDNWHLMGFGAASGYRGALAWRGAARTILAFQLAA